MIGLLWVLLCAGCGGGGSASNGTGTGSVSLQVLWEGTANVPDHVSQVEIRIDPAHGGRLRSFVDPRQQRSATIEGVPIGPATVQVLGYDAPSDVPGLIASGIPPSYKSAPVQVTVPQGRTADAGTLDALAEAYIAHDLTPLPGAVAVPRDAPVSFLLTIDLGTADLSVDVGSIDISIAGSVVVKKGSVKQTGATLEPSGHGFRFQFTPQTPFDPFQAVEVIVSASATDSTRSFSGFSYTFTTGTTAPPNRHPD